MISLAGCVLIDKRGRIGLLHRNTPRHTQWELPGGKVKSNETDEDAAERELAEELGIKVVIQKRLGSASFTDIKGTYNYVWFLADIVSGKPAINEPQTFDDFAYFSIRELETLNLSENMKKLLTLLKDKQIIKKS